MTEEEWLDCTNPAPPVSNGLKHFHQAKGRLLTPEDFKAWWPRGGCP
jgi:hypothetical protein